MCLVPYEVLRLTMIQAIWVGILYYNRLWKQVYQSSK